MKRALIGLLALSLAVPAGISLARSDKSVEDEPRLTHIAWVSTPVLDPVPTTTTTTTTTSTTTTTTTVVPTTTTTTQAPYLGGNSGGFALPPDAKLPSETECAQKVVKTRELRPENVEANKTKPNKKFDFGTNWGSNPASKRYHGRVTGNFTGTTDEIIQWASCKWGLETDVTRAQAVVESNWRQTAKGAQTNDQTLCIGEMQVPCPRAFGIMQLRADYHPSTYPWSATSTAFNVDYALAMRRACYDGNLWVGPQSKGNAWGCVGVHYSGKWLDDKANMYIPRVQSAYDRKSWPRI